MTEMIDNFTFAPKRTWTIGASPSLQHYGMEKAGYHTQYPYKRAWSIS